MKRKLLTLALALAMVFAVLPAAQADAVDPSTLEFVELDWYIGILEMPDAQMVNDAVNEYLMEKLNAKVNIHYWGEATDWETTMTTMISGGQDVGIIGFGSQSKLDYVIQSQRGAFYPIEDLLETHGQGTKALFDDQIWEAMKINGHIYGIPSLKDNGYYISLVYNADMAEELGINVDDYQYRNFRDLEPLFYEVKEKRDAAHPEMADRPVVMDNNWIMPYNFAMECFLNDSYLAVCNIPGIDDIAGYDADTVVNFYATDEFLEFAIQKQRMVADGIYAYDYKDRTEWNYDGVNFAWVGWGYTYMQEHLYGDLFTTKMKIAEHLWTDTGNFFSAGTAISANCANPERALMILNLVNTDPEFATMMRLGLEGQHYVYDEEGKMQIGGERNSGERAEWGYYYWYGAPIGNLTIVKAPEALTGPDNIMLTKMAEYNASCSKAQHLGFSFNTEPVRNEIAACTNIVQEYQKELVAGQAGSEDEVKALVAEFNEKLTANGVEAIVAEVQSQIDAWNASR